MVDSLSEELLAIGLIMNASKTKILTTVFLDTPLYIDMAGTMVEVLSGSTCHKYLGRHLPGNLSDRGGVELTHRLKAAWGKFHKHRGALLNKHVAIKSRLRLFESAVTPTVLYGLCTLPMTQHQREQLDIVQRRMLRAIVGWARLPDEDWAETMRRVNHRMSSAMALFPIRPWTTQLASRQFSLAAKLAARSTWASKAIKWPLASLLDGEHTGAPFRTRGRPKQRWDDALTNFSKQVFPSKSSWIDSAKSRDEWFSKEQQFLQFCS